MVVVSRGLAPQRWLRNFSSDCPTTFSNLLLSQMLLGLILLLFCVPVSAKTSIDNEKRRVEFVFQMKRVFSRVSSRYSLTPWRFGSYSGLYNLYHRKDLFLQHSFKFFLLESKKHRGKWCSTMAEYLNTCKSLSKAFCALEVESKLAARKITNSDPLAFLYVRNLLSHEVRKSYKKKFGIRIPRRISGYCSTDKCNASPKRQHPQQDFSTIVEPADENDERIRVEAMDDEGIVDLDLD